MAGANPIYLSASYWTQLAIWAVSVWTLPNRSSLQQFWLCSFNDCFIKKQFCSLKRVGFINLYRFLLGSVATCGKDGVDSHKEKKQEKKESVKSKAKNVWTFIHNGWTHIHVIGRGTHSTCCILPFAICIFPYNFHVDPLSIPSLSWMRSR